MDQIKVNTKRKAWWGHFQLWKWLSENPEKQKKDWPGWEVYISTDNRNPSVRNHCFCCEIVVFLQNSLDFVECDKCPIKWRESDNYCGDSDTIYCKWRNEDDPVVRAKLAIQIRDAWPEPSRELEYINIDSWNRPIFKEKGTSYFYGSCDILFQYYESESEVKNKVSEKDLLYFGNSFDCEPIGTNPGKIKIIWSEK